MLVLTAVAAIGGLTLLLAGLLVVADRKLRVEEDPRIDAVDDQILTLKSAPPAVAGDNPKVRAWDMPAGAINVNATTTADGFSTVTRQTFRAASRPFLIFR